MWLYVDICIKQLKYVYYIKTYIIHHKVECVTNKETA